MTTAASAPLVALNLLAASIWVGGLVAIFVVARAADASLAPAQRVELFRALGRRYGVVGSAALLVALVSGAVLLRDHPWDGVLVATAIVAASLVLVSLLGMAQARAMTRLRRRALRGPDPLADEIDRGARLATLLRAAIAVLTLVLLVLAAVLVA